MTSLDRLRQAMSPGENGRSPVLSSEAVKASLGEYGLSAADQLLSSAGFGVEINSDKSSLESITSPEIRAEFENDYATYEQIFAGAGVMMPTAERLAAAGIDWAHLAELKEQHPRHELVVAPLTMKLDNLRQMVSAVTNDQSIPNNPLKKYKRTKTGGDGLWINYDIVNNWDGIMARSTSEWQLPTATLDNSKIWTAYLMPSQDKPENLSMSYQQVKELGLTTITIPGYIAYQMKRIKQWQPPIGQITWTWALGEYTDSDGDVCAPFVNWLPVTGRVRVGWYRVDDSLGRLGVRSPVG